MSFASKTILVAGVGGGLGAAVVSLLASEGAHVIAVARTRKALDPIAAHARKRNWNVDVETADLHEPRTVDELVGRVGKAGGLDGVSINIGHWLGGENLLHKMSEKEWTDAIRDNLDPIYLLGRATLPLLIARGHGALVAVGAAPAIRTAGSASYQAAKGGLADLVPRLARDYRLYGVRVNAVLPGSMSHEASEELDPPAADGPIALTDATATSPWEVGRAVRFLLSDESRWVTGALLVVDGGLSTGGAESK